MSTKATVNYHIHKPERQAFELDAGGIVGNLISPELITTEIDVLDVRGLNADLSFQSNSVAFADFATDLDVLSNEDVWRSDYESDLEIFLKAHLNIDDVLIFDHTVRVDNDSSVRKPARHVHSDYSIDGAQQRLVDLLGKEQAAEWAARHYAFINVWRPVETEIGSAPLGFILTNTVNERDWILLDLIYPHRRGQILGLAANESHQWIYQSKMTPNEAVFFNIFDNQGLAAIPHSALDMIEGSNLQMVRKSIESRTLVRYRHSHNE